MENEILFENVSFSYDGKEVFRNLNVRIPSDRHVALVGENGAGKSTFIKLLLGLYEPKQGSILVDGRPVKDRTPKERKRLFAAAFQDFYRYPLSVKENLSMCQNGEKTTADYIAALEMVGLETLKDKLDYLLPWMLPRTSRFPLFSFRILLSEQFCEKYQRMHLCRTRWYRLHRNASCNCKKNAAGSVGLGVLIQD